MPSPASGVRRSAFWRRPDIDEDAVDADGDDTSSGEEEEEELMSASSSEEDEDSNEDDEEADEAEHGPGCVCHLGGRMTPSLYINPPTLEREGRSEMPLLVLLRAHTLLDALELRPATRLKTTQQSPKHAHEPATANPSWKDLDRLLQSLDALMGPAQGTAKNRRTRKAKGKNGSAPAAALDSGLSSPVYQASLEVLHKRLQALLQDERIISKPFRHALAADEAKALSTILRRIRTIPAPPSHVADDPFVVSLQRTSLNQVALRIKYSEIQREIASESWQQRGSRFSTKPTIPGHSTAHSFEPFRRTILRSGQQNSSCASVVQIVQRYGACLAPESDPDGMSLRELTWIEEPGGGGVRFAHVVPFLSKEDIHHLQIIKSPASPFWLVPPSLCLLPSLSRVEVLESCKRMTMAMRASSRVQPSPQAADSRAATSTAISGTINSAQVLANAKRICAERAMHPLDAFSRTGSSHTTAPPSLAALCAILIQGEISSGSPTLASLVDDRSSDTDTTPRA
ncbi:hypothetical protein OC842_006588 [Tilletia horrida]|uniref:Uncharacterized protein n=1 Tax=Tilletia horrida TaxID=155126 RepID=A0AAN6G5Q1_9BASI|nr:hypothetical protein OC842_006588 [Tilletia horrida]